MLGSEYQVLAGLIGVGVEQAGSAVSESASRAALEDGSGFLLRTPFIKGHQVRVPSRPVEFEASYSLHYRSCFIVPCFVGAPVLPGARHEAHRSSERVRRGGAHRPRGPREAPGASAHWSTVPSVPGKCELVNFETISWALPRYKTIRKRPRFNGQKFDYRGRFFALGKSKALVDFRWQILILK